MQGALLTGRRNGLVARLGVLALIAALLAPVGVARPGASPDVSLLVRGVDGVPSAEAAVLRAGGQVLVRLPIIDGVAARVPAHRVGVLDASSDVAGIAPNQRVRLAEVEDSSGPSAPSVYPRAIGADRLWAEAVTGRGVRVALVDTGVSPVPDLADRLVSVPDPFGSGQQVPCVNFSGEPGCDDSYGHGTFLAGLIAGSGRSSGGAYRGVAPGADLVSIKIAGRDGSADVTKVLAAIQWVVSFADALSIRVLNLSLGTDSTVSYRFDPLNYAVERAWRSGLVVVVAASNRGPEPGTISKPADDPLVITAGAVDDRESVALEDDTVPEFTGRGPTAPDGLAKPDVVAPGGRVVSLRAPGSFVEEHAPGGIDEVYRRGSGTSMSAAIVSGAAALMLEAKPGWKPDRVKYALMETARPVASVDPMIIGRGMVDVHAAVRSAPDGNANRSVSTTSDGSGALDGGRHTMRVANRCLGSSADDPDCDEVRGRETAHGRQFDRAAFTGSSWYGSSWYSSQWVGLAGSSWYGSSWYGSSWYGSSWYGSSWYGMDESTFYGVALAGSSWYGVWD